LEKKITKISSNKNELEITLTKEEFGNYFNKAVNKTRPLVQLAGFRKGKVPKNMVIKHYGESIKQDAIEEAGQQEFAKIVEADDIKVIGSPAMVRVEDSDGDTVIAIEYEIYPEFQLNDYKGITLSEPVHEVTDTEVQSEIDEILKSQSTFEDSNIITDKFHVIGFNKIELDAVSKLPLDGSIAEEEHLYLSDKNISNNLIDAVMNCKVGDKVNYVLEHDTNHDHHQGNHSHTFEVEILDIQKAIPAEYTDEIVKKYTEGKFDTTDDFNDEIQFQIQEKWDKNTRNELENQIVAQLTDANDIDVPEAFIESATDIMVENFTKQFSHIKGFDNQNFDGIREEFYTPAKRTVQWELIRNKIIEEENIEVEEFDIEPLAQKEAERSKESAEQIKKMMMENENFRMSILNKKVIDYILDFAITDEIDFDEYKKNETQSWDNENENSDDDSIDGSDEYEILDDQENMNESSESESEENSKLDK